ncbi:efflux RND transporter periplasmic adaptor subunit, partial [Planctomycetota bacterium]
VAHDDAAADLLSVAGPGTITLGGSYPGEVILNPDRLVHVVPRAPGIVREVTKTLGDRVEAGEILAWIESAALAESKLTFYAKLAEVGCCKMALPRAREIFENTNRLLTLLEKKPSREELRKLRGLEMGEYRGRLLTAYAEYVAAEKSRKRERDLRDKKISSEKDAVEAEAAFEKAEAELAAAMDIARYQVLVGFSEAAREQQVAEFEAVAAEQQLRLKGVGDDVVTRLGALVPKTASLEPCTCDDPECKDGTFPSVLDTLGKEERLGWYPLRAPFGGIVTEKHLTLGEKVGDEDSVFTIADTSSVWVRFNVYQGDLGVVRAGQSVRVDPGPGVPEKNGTIAYLSPIVDEATRTAQARVVLQNADGAMRPGLFGTVHVAFEAIEAEVVIPKDAVQVLDEEDVVFVEAGDGFLAVPIRRGRADRTHVVIEAGLKPGQRYVTRGGFELKATVAISGLDAHAGHGH